jgi:hypothetical protein
MDEKLSSPPENPNPCESLSPSESPSPRKRKPAKRIPGKAAHTIELNRATKHWQDAERIIVEKVLKGAGVDEICLTTGYPRRFVYQVAHRKTLADEVRKTTRAVLEAKVPILEEITELTLTAVRDWLKETIDPANEELRAIRLREAKDVRALAQIASELNDMLRLELGKQTSNAPIVQYNFDQAKILLQNLREKDPVFEYPALDAPREENKF